MEIDDQMYHDIIDICIALRDYESALKYADILESDTDELYKHRNQRSVSNYRNERKFNGKEIEPIYLGFTFLLLALF